MIQFIISWWLDMYVIYLMWYQPSNTVKNNRHIYDANLICKLRSGQKCFDSHFSLPGLPCRFLYYSKSTFSQISSNRELLVVDLQYYIT